MNVTYKIPNLGLWFRSVTLCERVHKSCRLEGATFNMSGNINPLPSLTSLKLRFLKVTAVGTSNPARYGNCYDGEQYRSVVFSDVAT
jgi:hypothetical protein